MTDTHGDEKQYIKEYFAIYRPTNAHQRLQNAASDIKGDKQETLYEKYRVGFGLFKHSRKQYQQQEGAKCHQIIQGKNADKPFSKEIFGMMVCGKHNHKAADDKKNINSKGAAV